MNFQSKNVFGESLQNCSTDPVTGYYRNGCCDSGEDDRGDHMVCAIMTEEFLEFSKAKGNDLSTPMPQFNFPGLKPGDKWCLCAARWKEAYNEGMAPLVVLEATNELTLEVVSMEVLLEYAYKEGRKTE
ncbi:DUF2237 family protein [Rhodohalobacter sp. 614A]|uniref:DUF2237 family protein n=1 Tax=Rhodohalobacter sp. 614A TaxID=2908649 RepID=UPI001F16FA12|nr:DUF2237 domain-containing protein [Rhodohalobacter sp. 614A]